MADSGPDDRMGAAQERLAQILQQAGLSDMGLNPGSQDALEELGTALEELRTAEEELRQQNEELATARIVIEAERQRYLDLFEHAPDAYLVTNLGGVILEANNPAETLLRVSPRLLSGKPLVLFVAEPERKDFHTLLQRVQSGQRPLRCELTIAPRSGEPIAAAAMVAPVCDAQGVAQSLRWTLRDVSHRRQAEQQLFKQQEDLRDLASRLVLAEEHARRAIAVGIHDEMSQPLALLQLKLGVALGAASDDGLREQLADAQQVLKRVIETSRTLTFEASSPVLYELGFGSALEWLVEDVCLRHGISPHFSVSGEPLTLTDDVKVLVFRAVRELLASAAERAHARNVRVVARWLPNHLRITVTGDGTESALPEGEEETNRLLFAVRERMAHLGGSLVAEHDPAVGPQVTVTAPASKSAAVPPEA